MPGLVGRRGDPRRGSAGRADRERPGRPGRAHRAGRDGPLAARPRAAVRRLPRAPAARARARPPDLQAALRPSRREPSRARHRDRPRARHRPEPRLRGARRTATCPTSRSTTRPARGSPATASRASSSTPRHRRARSMRFPSSTGWPRHAEAHRPSLDPDPRLRADPDRPGVRVRLLGRAGLPGAPPRGLPRDPRQLEPGDDHDRPRVGRRHLPRAARSPRRSRR